MITYLPRFRHTFLLLMLLPLVGLGQTAGTPGNYISVTSGVTGLTEADKIVSPLHYSGTAVPLSAEYEATNKRNSHHLRFTFFNTKLQSRSLNTRKFRHIEFNYRYFRAIGDLPVPLLKFPVQIFLGGSWVTGATRTTQHLVNAGFENTELNDSGYLSSALEASLQAMLALDNRQQLTYRLSVPVVGYVLRPGFSLFDPNLERKDSFLNRIDDGRIQTLDQFQHLFQSMRYSFRVTTDLSLIATATLMLNRIKQPETYASVIHRVNLGVRLKL